jgi:hypothetical protein
MSASTSIALRAAPDAGYAFSGWTGDCSGTDPTFILLVNGTKSCGAVFAAAVTSPSPLPSDASGLPLGAPYTLTIVQPTGGVVKAAGVNCGTHANNCTVSVSGPMTMGLQATPDPGHIFLEWTGNCSGTSASYSLALEGPRTCSAAFTRSQ